MNDRNEQDRTHADVAEEVRTFYDRYPYPRPVANLDKYRRLGQDDQRRRGEFHLVWPTRSYRSDLSILIAGCGTSQAAKHALRWPNAQVTGIDFSATSVRATEELKRKYNLNNLHLRQLPIEQAAELEKNFDQIICTGVLHHLANPDAGLAALHRVLKPDGAMQLMVYAPYGRTGIYMLQEFCQRTGVHATDEGIRELIAAIQFLPPGHPLETLLREAPDFRQADELADALLHPQDRAYSVPQLFKLIENGGFAFGRWTKQAPYSPQCGSMALIPQAARITQLPLAEQFAAVELFRGTMVRHSAILYRNDAPQAFRQHPFAGDSWLTYVPIRLPDTICVQERLPPGAAAVLINQTHAYRDLYLPINTTEMHWFRKIDGIRSIGEITSIGQQKLGTTAGVDAARGFFEQLWSYDQVVFDAAPRTADTLR